jgi:tRNA threonylcarbamoyladenosine biosynthesis protein TsaB
MTATEPTRPQLNRVLAIDTATRTQSIALLEGTTVLEHSQRRVKFNHGSSLLVHIARMLESQELSVADIELVAVGRGPGSFTGLRVGIAIAKSLARAHCIPLVGVSTLAALAHPAACAHPDAAVCATFDARRREVYTGLYAHNTDAGGGLRLLEADRAATTAELRARLLKLAETRPVVLVGDGPHKYADLSDWPTADVTVLAPWAGVPSAVSVALLARLAAQRGEFADVAALEPNYIRPTEAEIKFGR